MQTDKTVYNLKNKLEYKLKTNTKNAKIGVSIVGLLFYAWLSHSYVKILTDENADAGSIIVLSLLYILVAFFIYKFLDIVYLSIKLNNESIMKKFNKKLDLE